MADSGGVHQSADGSSFGTAVYISANRQGTGTAKSSFIWGLNFSGLRIAGPFEYGIRAYNYDDNTYNHKMRIEALMDACKVGVSLENCHKAYISATVQPRAAADGVVYAACGIQLVNSKDTDLTGSRVWDWGTSTTLWTHDKSNVNQHIALYGDCRGTILNDYNYFHLPDGFTDLRELIYTNTPANFDSLIILQEPITKWFKPKEDLPYFRNGETEKRLCLHEELQGHFQTDRVSLFDDKLAKATGKDGTAFGTNGYIRNGTVWDVNGNLTANAYNGCTGLIPCKQGDVIHADGLSFANADDVSRVIFFDASHNMIVLVNRGNLLAGSYYAGYEETENGFKVTLAKGLSQAAYAVFNFKTGNIGSEPVIAVNEEIAFTYSGYLSDGIRVKAESVDGLGNIGGGIAVTGAAVGQTVKISAVDGNGVPTAWEPVDLPSGGGGDTWELIAQVAVEAANTVSVIEQDLGAAYKKVLVYYRAGSDKVTTAGNWKIAAGYNTTRLEKTFTQNNSWTMHQALFEIVYPVVLLDREVRNSGLNGAAPETIAKNGINHVRISTVNADAFFPAALSNDNQVFNILGVRM